MWKMSSQLDTIIKAYKTLSKVPLIVGGKLNNDAKKITAKWSVRNLDKGKSIKYTNSYLLDRELNVISESDFGTDVSDELLSAVSPRENFKALIRDQKNGKEPKKQFLEIWNKTGLAHCVDLTALDIHGDVYADSEFGTLEWSYDETAIVYVAEKKLQKSEPFFKRKAEDKSKTDDGTETTTKRGEEFVYKQDWGEQLVGKHLSVIVVCQIQTEAFTILQGLPEDWCPGQVRFTPDGRGVIGVAWPTEPRRLGLIFCTNRPSYIFTLSYGGKMKKLSGEGLSARAPRVVGGATPRALWLQRAAGGAHHAAHQLVYTRLDEPGPPTVIIDIVETKVETENELDFHGLYCLSLLQQCSTEDGKRIIFSTPQKNEIRSYIVDIDGGRIVDISNRSSPGSTTVLDVKSDVMLASCSSMTSPPQLYVAEVPHLGAEAGVRWARVSSPAEVPPSLTSSSVEYMHLEHDNSEDSVKSFSALYFAPKIEDDKKVPLVVWPHGGPHSSFVNSFSLEAALFNMMGFASLQVNYRGSTGAGQASVQFLPARVGDADVKDCKLATDVALEKYPVDAAKLCLFGGSHGGFLVTHLSGQYPDVYRVVVTRNPVTDVASMINSTDIADWCAVEAGFVFTEQGPVSEEELLRMRRCSPLAHAHNVLAPTAVMLGAGDKRVPHYQGLEYARRLRANGVPVRIYMYDDNHSLSSLPADSDNLINGVHWFLKHLEVPE